MTRATKQRVKNTYRLAGDHAVLTIHTATVQQYDVLIDAEDLERVKNAPQTWYLAHQRHGQRRVIGSGATCERLMLTEFLIGKMRGMCIDHINHDTLDNRKRNLRNVTSAMNAQNNSVQRRSSTGVRGVYQSQGRFIATVMVDGDRVFRGVFKDLALADMIVRIVRAETMPGSIEYMEARRTDAVSKDAPAVTA